jgi:hypothetical protein
LEKKQQINLSYALIAFLLLMVFQSWWVAQQQIETIPYSEFQALLEQGAIEEVRVSERFVQGRLRQPTEAGAQYFRTNRVEIEMADRLREHDVRFAGEIENTFFRDLLSWVLPILILIGFWVFMIRRFAEKQGFGGLMQVGKSKAKVYVETDTKVTFADVAGVDEAKDELMEIVNFPEGPRDLRPAGRAHSQGHPAGRPARHRQDAARPRRGRRGGGAVLLDLGLGVRRDVRGRGCGARPRSLRAGRQVQALHHLHRRARRAWAGRGWPASSAAAGTTRRSRP